MAITASGLFGLTQEKMMIDTAGQSLEAETHNAMLVLDAYTPAFDTHDFRADVTNEASGTGYTSGGINMTTTEVTVGSPAAGQLKYDADDFSWSSSTIASAMAAVGYFDTGSSATDMLIFLLDFVTAASTTAGLLLVTIHADGIYNLDYTP